MRVAVLDDDEAALARGCNQVKALEREPYRVLVRSHRPMDDILDEVQSVNCGAVISDHRFRTRSQVSFNGAELVYRSNERGLPAILYSAHVDEDEADSIRAWRYGIPRVVKKAPGALKALGEALRVAESEAHGERELARQGFVTPVRVVGIPGDREVGKGHGGRMVEVTVTAWRPRTPIPMPASLLPEDHRELGESLIGQIFLGEVNYYAENENELFFHNLKAAPNPRPSGFERKVA
ncbi:DNA-binding transcriptional response regulator [Streptomyces erythrochromogenes]|uniref:hypothetical protein n=1 Tax=Streptomyces erythrochromogenes TaxID=285574 RepID=UPI0036AC3B2B